MVYGTGDSTRNRIKYEAGHKKIKIQYERAGYREIISPRFSALCLLLLCQGSGTGARNKKHNIFINNKYKI